MPGNPVRALPVPPTLCLMRPRHVLATLLGLAIAASPAAASGSATIPGLVLDPFTSEAASWSLPGMPDLDQLRQESSTRRYLPNEGRMYCVPTSGTNLLAVLGAMGQTDGVIDGTRDWQAQANYDDAVSSIYQVGRSMSTDPEAGTGAATAVAGMRAHLNRQARAAGTRIWSRHAYSSYAPQAGDLVEVGKNGGLMMISYGIYERGEDSSGVFWDRLGGHAISVSAAWANATGEVGGVYVRDPGTNNSLDTLQSTFAAESKTLGERARMRLRQDGNFYTIYVTPYDTSGVRFLEGYIGIYPERLWALSPGRITRLTPEPLVRDDPELDEFPIPSSGAVDVAATPTGSLLVLGRRGQITEMGIGSGQKRTAARRVGTVAGATQVAAMPSGAIIAAGPGRVTLLPAEGKRQVFALRTGTITDLAFDHGRNEIQVLINGRTVVALKGTRQTRRAVKGGRATYLNVTATGVTPGRQILTSAGRAATVAKDGTLRLGEKSWTLRPGARVVAAWVMPDAISGTPGIIDGGKTGDVWEQPVRANLQVIGVGQGRIAVRNTGPIAAPASHMEVTSGNARALIDVPALSPMATSEPYRPACTGEFTALADAKDAVAESVEADNRLTGACPPQP